MKTFELKHYMLYLFEEKVCMCRLAEVKACTKKKLEPHSATFVESPQI
jgi:hypothetical protein